MDTITKSPIEKFQRHFNFSADLLPSETIVVKTVTCVNAATGVTSAATIIDSEAIASLEVDVVLKGGTEGEEHSIQCVITTNLGGIFQRDLLLAIQSVVDDSFNKRPDDAFMFDVNFSHHLEGGDTLASVVGVATKESDGTDVSLTVLPSPDLISPRAGVRVTAGDDGETYLLRIQGTSAAGYIFEKIIRMNVQERP